MEGDKIVYTCEAQITWIRGEPFVTLYIPSYEINECLSNGQWSTPTAPSCQRLGKRKMFQSIWPQFHWKGSISIITSST